MRDNRGDFLVSSSILEGVKKFWMKHIDKALQKCPCKAPGTRLKARNCISEPGPQEPYRAIL
jgi:hypothetical protein